MQKIMIHKYVLLFLYLICINLSSFAREIDCNVVVNHQKIQDVDAQIFKNLEKAMMEFTNNRNWTTDHFELSERISCSFLINIESRENNDYRASIQVQATRPVYGTNYSTTMFVINDQDFDFSYVDQMALDFNIQSFQSNLTSVFAFYIYFILGLDYDSFELEGGTKLYQKAFEVVNNAQGSGGKGWSAGGTDRNRYWLIENITNSIFAPFRKMVYSYHLLGLDVMRENKIKGEDAVFEALISLDEVQKARPSSFLLQVYFNAKSDEVVSVFKTASPERKKEIMKAMILIDPGNTKKYNRINE